VADADRRTARPLGRGFEDVSHLFLSRQRDEPGHESVVDRTAVVADGRPGARSGAAVLRPGEAITREKLTATLRECQGALEANLRTIDACIPCRPGGDIDLLAVDEANRLCVIDIEIAASDELLLRGVGHVAWLVRNLAVLPRMYSAWGIDFSQQPRLLLVAPGFSSLLINAIRALKGPDITCFRCHSVKTSAGTAIFFEQAVMDE
jgi:hypothetical protein